MKPVQILTCLLVLGALSGVSLVADNVQSNFVPGDFGPAAEKLGLEPENGYYDLGKMLDAAMSRIEVLEALVDKATTISSQLLLDIETLTERVSQLESRRDDAALFVSITDAPASVARGNITSITVRTASCAVCSIAVKLPSGAKSAANGLEQKTAGEDSTVTWTWLVSGNTAGGTATATITCSRACETQSVMWQFQILE